MQRNSHDARQRCDWLKQMVYAKTIAAFAERLEAGSARAEEPRR
jgi:hypothetical protein